MQAREKNFKFAFNTLLLINMNSINFHNTHFVSSFGTPEQLPLAELPEVVFCGRSNVGKSSLINALCNQNKLAKTSQKPGKTATINFYACNEIYLVDLPGYGFAHVSHTERARWSELINSYFSDNRNFNLVVCLIDMRHEPQPLDFEMLSFLRERDLPFVIALTKCDKLAKSKVKQAVKRTAALLEMDEMAIFPVSAHTKTGLDALKNMIKEATL